MLKTGVDPEEFVSLIDQMYDEIFIWDKDMRVIYCNEACYTHYGMKEEDFIGKTIDELSLKEKLWSPTCVPDTYENKKPFIQRQTTFLGYTINTISVPVFDSFNNVKYIVQCCRESEKHLNDELTPLKTDDNGSSIVETDFIYKSAEMDDLLKEAEIVANTKASILILGETGVGKTKLARYIHDHSDRRDKPFININMASLSPSLIESELFGYERGAFTGAKKEGKKGILYVANGGTLFLDEIGEFPYELQAKFLNVIQDEEFIPVGGNSPIKLDLRIISATNCDLNKSIEAGKFRKDMYHRLNTIELTIPPLSDRPEDILILASYFLKIYNEKYKRNVTLSREVIDIFEEYTWDGNARELSNVIERGIITAEDEVIRLKNLPESFFSVDNRLRPAAPVDSRIDMTKGYNILMQEYESRLINMAYTRHPSSRKLAEALGLSQTKASKLIKKYVRKNDEE